MRAKKRIRRNSPFYLEKRTVYPDIILFKRRDTDQTFWWFRVKTGVSKPLYVTRSTNETDEQKASESAIREGIKIQLTAKETDGRGITARTFSQVADAYLKALKRDTDNRLKKKSRYTRDSNNIPKWKRYIGANISIANVSQRKIDGYATFRREEMPSIQGATIAQEQGSYNRLIKWAVDQSWLRPIDARTSQLTISKRDYRTRGGFTQEEFAAILDFFENVYLTEKVLPPTRRRRQQLYNYIRFLAGSGMRADEARSMTWEGLYNRDEAFFARPTRSKTERPNRIIQPASLEEIALEAVDDQRNLFWEGNPAPNDLVFRGRNKTGSIGDPNETFRKSVIDRIPIFDKPKNKSSPEKPLNKTMTDFRHYYATERLTRGDSVNHVATMMRTSAQQIESHYGHVIAERAEAERRKRASDEQRKAQEQQERHEELLDTISSKGRRRKPTQPSYTPEEQAEIDQMYDEADTAYREMMDAPPTNPDQE